jgi:prepilin-type N-terminal cleavage/methylation domain-containing protein
MNEENNAGFTIIELVIVIAILVLLSAIAIPDFISFQKKTDLDNSIQEFASALRTAQSKTLSSENDSQYGVYLKTSVSPNQYILFKGTSYAGHDAASDHIYSLKNTSEFFNISLGGGNEIVFDKLTGVSEESGSVSARIKTDTSYSKTVYISNSGAVGFSAPVAPSDSNRTKDSRHLEVAYSRVINTGSENIVLTFDNSQTKTIQINSFLQDGELQWQGTVTVGGSDQKVEISTLRLNNADTLFNIHRDRRYNDKSLKITISGDSSGSIAEYSADGLTVSHSSIYVSSSNQQ